MIPIMTAGGLGLVLSLFGTPLFIRVLVKRKYGQFIRDDGPTTHHTKRGTPTMGGVVLILATTVAYFLAHLVTDIRPSVSGLLALFLMVGLGLVGFLDDYIKISRQRSLGLKARSKLTGQILIATVFALLALQFPNIDGLRPASTSISFLRDTGLDLAFAGVGVGLVLFALWANLMVAAWSNGVNLTDGLDGLATGVSAMVFGSYLLIGLWQFRQACSAGLDWNDACYQSRDPLDLAIFAAAVVGACIGFLWWNTSPAKIFMGDTGSLALGGALAGLSILTRTELLAIILGGLFVIITASVAIQVGFFKMTRKRVFRMAPLQHHFELKGWAEVTIVVRFWIIAAFCVSLGLAIFYAEWGVTAL